MDLSVIIPAREEEFLQRTIDDILVNMRGDTEIIVVLDGYKPEITRHPWVNVIHNPESIGQRAACNQAVRTSQAKYIMKCDAHCAFDIGFDVKLMTDCEPDWVVIPRMYALDAFHWVCRDCGKQYNQGPEIASCERCGGSLFERKIIWKPKKHKKTDYMFFDNDLRVKYFDGNGLSGLGDIGQAKEKYKHNRRHWAQDDITDVMCGVGACWFLERDYYWQLGGMDEQHGSWGQMAVEIACKTWLSGGRHVVNKKTWFAHLFRTQKGFSWPYENKAIAQENARKYSRDLWLNNKWPEQKHKLSWLIDKFSPLPTWENTERNLMTTDATIIYYTANKIPEKFASKVKDQIKYASPGYPIISVSQKPLSDMGVNTCVGNIGQSLQNIYRQILIAAKKANTEYIICCEDDTLYVPDYFKHRPKNAPFAYNLNRWNLHTNKKIYSFWDRIVMSQCIARREALIKTLEERLALPRIPKEYCGEPGRFERQLGITGVQFETFQTKEPNIVVAHEKNTTGIKLIGKDAEPRQNIEPWGDAERLLKALCLDDDMPVKNKEITQAIEKKPKYRKPRSKYNYIKSKIFEMKELCKNRLSYIDVRKPESQRNFLQVFPPFMERVHNGEEFTDEQLRALPYHDYLISKLNPADKDPLTRKGARHVISQMREAINLYHDIKGHGLKAPLDFWWHKDNLILIRGGRRLEILKLLGRKKVPSRVFPTKYAFDKHNPSKDWGLGFRDDNSIHELAVKQFCQIGGKATDKYWVHGYTPLYDKEIGHLRNKKAFRLLEIGVKKGASLKLWQQAFPQGEIYGIDKDEIAIQGFKIFIGDQQDKDFLVNVAEEAGPFDVIIDDGSHIPAHQKISLETLWPYLSEQGVYVIEDLHWNYLSDSDSQAVDALKDMVTNIYTDSTVASVNFYYNICFIRKN